jgi:membrane protease YdiL (CAAX protease family)
MPLQPETVVPLMPRLLAAGVLTASGLAVIPLALHVLRRAAPEPEPGLDPAGRAPWTPTELVLVVVLVIASGFVFHLALPGDEAAALLLGFLAAAASLAAGVAGAAAMARRAGVAPTEALGLETRGLARAAGAGLLCYALFLPALLGVALGWTALLESAGVEELVQPVVSTMRELSVGDRPWALLFGILIGPLFEELLFRGVLQRTLARHLAAWAAVGITSACFAALHGAAAFLPVFALSLILGGIAHKTRRVLAAWLVHAAFNAQTFVFLWWLPEIGRALEGGKAGLLGG